MVYTPISDPKATYSLKEAAQLLGIDIKTLHKKMEALRLTASPSADDKRARLLSAQQVAVLRQHLQARWSVPSLQDVVTEVAQARERELDQRTAVMIQEQKAMKMQLDEITRTLQEMRGKLDKLQPEALPSHPVKRGQ